MLADELFSKDLRRFETRLSLSNNVCKKIVPSLESPVIFYERFRVTRIQKKLKQNNFTVAS